MTTAECWVPGYPFIDEDGLLKYRAQIPVVSGCVLAPQLLELSGVQFVGGGEPSCSTPFGWDFSAVVAWMNSYSEQVIFDPESQQPQFDCYYSILAQQIFDCGGTPVGSPIGGGWIDGMQTVIAYSVETEQIQIGMLPVLSAVTEFGCEGFTFPLQGQFSYSGPRQGTSAPGSPDALDGIYENQSIFGTCWLGGQLAITAQ